MFDEETLSFAELVVSRCIAGGKRLVIAESCTGGLISGVLTAISGSSQVLDRSFVTYSNVSKEEELSVPSTLIEEKGAVSQEVAAEFPGPTGHLGVCVSQSNGGSNSYDAPSEDKVAFRKPPREASPALP